MESESESESEAQMEAGSSSRWCLTACSRGQKRAQCAVAAGEIKEG
jgi:hypothetical protein